ncbi:MAG: hypothetical protein ACOX0W_02835 [Sphaerochaetaceae bacterium]|jgi:hypothetical protein
MKKVFLVLALVLVLALPLTAASYSKTNGLGVGVSGGYPVQGVAVKYGMDDFRLVGTLGYSIIGSGSISAEVGAQYDVYQFDIGDLPFYVNAGVTGSFSLPSDFNFKEFSIAVNAPVGLSFFFEKVPVEAFLKVVPALAVLPAVKFGGVGGAIGALWYFD